MRIAVTGAAGQIGSELCRQLGPEAIALPRAELDITDAGRVAAKLTKIRPDAVINAAAYTHVDRAEEEREACRAVNVHGVENLAAACRKLDCPLVEVSTDYVFASRAAAATVPLRESDPTEPRGVYAQSKRAGEEVAAGCEQHLIVRTCGLYAAGHSGNFPAKILSAARSGKTLRVVNDQHCTPSYVPDVARAVLFLLRGACEERGVPWGVYHVTNRGETTWHAFAVELLRQVGLDVPVEPVTTDEYAAPAPRPRYSVLDTSKYESVGGPPLPTWQEAIAAYARALRSTTAPE